MDPHPAEPRLLVLDARRHMHFSVRERFHVDTWESSLELASFAHITTIILLPRARGNIHTFCSRRLSAVQSPAPGAREHGVLDAQFHHKNVDGRGLIAFLL